MSSDHKEALKRIQKLAEASETIAEVADFFYSFFSDPKTRPTKAPRSRRTPSALSAEILDNLDWKPNKSGRGHYLHADEAPDELWNAVMGSPNQEWESGDHVYKVYGDSEFINRFVRRKK